MTATVQTPPASTAEPVPLVLVHGLWDTPRLFEPLRAALAERRTPLLVPHLPHGLGWVPLSQLAEQLGTEIERALGPVQPLDLLGFSMGGVIGRSWIQLLGGRSAPAGSSASPAPRTAPWPPCPGRAGCWRASPT